MQHDPNFVETWVDDHTCYGHNPADVQPFHSLFLGEEALHSDSAQPRAPKSYYTNQELYGLFEPDGMAVPYVYDNFQWPHCDVS